MEEEKLKNLNKKQLLEMAKKQGLKGGSKMKKAELIQALSRLFRRKKKDKVQKVSSPRKRKRMASKKVKPELSQGSRLWQAAEKEEVELSKFEAGREIVQEVEFKPELARVGIEEKVEIPSRYGEDRLTLLVRDPWWIYAYWEITPQTWQEARAKVSSFPSKEVLRVYDVTDIFEFRGENARGFFDIELSPFADNWYINVGNPDRSYCAELGLRTEDGRFYPLLRSNTVRTPRYGMSPITDEEWMVSEEEYWKLFGLSGGYGIGKGSLEMQELFKKRFEELVSSGFPASVFSWMGKEEVARGFWLVADAELIIYGATQPDAKLSIQGQPVKLREDGTFSLRFALPDGIQEIPILANSSDGREKREIKITVRRDTIRGD